MSILSKIKEFFSSEETEEKLEKIKFNQISEKLENQLNQIKELKARIKKEIISEIENFNSEINEKKEKLSKINIDERKEEERIKNIVRENLRLYLDYLGKFLENLKTNENLEPENYIAKVSQIFNNFQANSRIAFEKATILIGGELGSIKESINSASKNIRKILDDNQNLLQKENLIKELKKLISISNEFNKNKLESENSISNLQSNSQVLEEKKQELENKIKNIKESQEYKEMQEEKLKKDKEKNELEREILKIKEKADLKYLAKFFHNDGKKSEIIKKYLENFQKEADEDETLEIINLAKEAERDIESLRDIKKKFQEIRKEKSYEIQESLEKIEKEATRLRHEIITCFNDIEAEKSKINKFEEKTKEIEREIREKAKNLLNLEIE